MADIIDITGKVMEEVGNNQNNNDIQSKKNLQFSPEQIEELRKKLQGKNKNNQITLKECVDIVDNFINGTCSIQQLEDFGSKMIVRAYIPLLEKMSILMKVFMQYEISGVESTEIKMTELYKNIFFFIVLREYGQVQFNEFNEEDKKLMTYENYDKLFPIFNHYILLFCREDYNMLLSMLKDCISLNGVIQLAESMKGFDIDTIKQSTERNKELVESLKENNKLVEDLKDIVMATDSNTKAVVTKIKKVALEDVKISQEKDKNNLII